MKSIKVSRFELYPKEEPTCYTVGFTYSYNCRTAYIDTQISFEEATDLSDEEIVDLAYEKLKETIELKLSDWESKSPLIGKELISPELPEEPTEEGEGI